MKPYLQYTFRFLWRQKKKFLFVVFTMAVGVGLRLIEPFFYKIIVDTLTNGLVSHVFTEAQVSLLIQIVASWFVLALVQNLLNGQNHYLTWEIANLSSQWVHIEGYRKLLKMDYYKHTQKHSSQYAKIVDEADTAMWHMTSWWLGRFMPAALGFVAMLSVALSMSWQMTLVSLSVIPPGLAIIIFMIKKYEDRQHKVNKLWNLKHEHMSDQISNIITYKLNQDEKRFIEIQKGFSDRGLIAQTDINKKWRITEMLNPDALARFMVMGLGIFLVKDGSITLGTLFMFMGLLTEILTPLHLLGDILPQYSRTARHIDKQLKLLADPDMILDPAQPLKIPEVQGRIEFKNVSFSYPSKEEGEVRKVLKNLSFVIEPGQTFALVGHSGAGKSTIMGLMTRLYDPTDGQILLDGVDIREYAQEDYRRVIGTVLQEHSMYNETVAENISYGKHGATREEVIDAAKKAVADVFIERLPKKYDTLIGERGVRLSGGEKQRLAIARAVLKNPKIVVLDEPTSALDSITEAKVQQGLDLLIEGRTCVVIAHRLSTVRNADKIILLRDGEIQALGSHAELLKTSPEYQEMVELQTGGFLADE